MNFRIAGVADIPQLSEIRLSVKENVLNNPSLVTYNDYVNFLTKNGKGWLCEEGNQVLGFSIIDTNGSNVWALFVKPGFEGKSIARQLQDLMLNWYFNQSQQTLWLSTSPNTRAQLFYEKSGWVNAGILKSGEIKFEMPYDKWQQIRGK